MAVSEAFLRWLSKQLRSHDESMRGMAKQAGISFTTVSRWFTDGNEPSAANIKKIARHYEVDTRVIYELLGRVTPVSLQGLSEDEILWLKLYRRLNAGERRKLVEMSGVLFGTAFDDEPGSEPHE
jgi:transcriptional regulator with XRE-family HTH domain